jgi:alkanesulfonate monooxygenase SsuD/methylene tetrahydromethanopterin reductase-like flavin-dependent oxidoreductase (luciferase family)
LEIFDSAWTYDHLYPVEGVGPTFEGWTTLALLSHHVPTMRVGHLVLANPYRHPSLLAKMATTMDHGTAGRFILGLGAGWYEPEAKAYGLRLGPIAQRLRDLEAAIRVISALLRDPAAAEWPGSENDSDSEGGVSIDAPPYELRHARNDPAPLSATGPPLWLGVQGERVGMRLVAQYADGWNFTGASISEFAARRDALLRHCDSLDRDAREITVSAQVHVPDLNRWAEKLDEARELAESGCDEIILYMEAQDGPRGLEFLAQKVAAPLKDLKP